MRSRPAFAKWEGYAGDHLAALVHPLTVAVRRLAYVVRLVRDGQDDLDGTYPDRRQPTGSESATTASVAMSLTGLGGSM